MLINTIHLPWILLINADIYSSICLVVLKGVVVVNRRVYSIFISISFSIVFTNKQTFMIVSCWPLKGWWWLRGGIFHIHFLLYCVHKCRDLWWYWSVGPWGGSGRWEEDLLPIHLHNWVPKYTEIYDGVGLLAHDKAVVFERGVYFISILISIDISFWIVFTNTHIFMMV